MSLPLNSNLAACDSNGRNFGNTNSKNDIIILNIKGNDESSSGNKSIEINQTEANLQRNNNKITQKSVIQRPNKILYYDNIRENQYPVSDNLRNQLSSKEKKLKPINNINNKIINEVNIHQNNNQQNYCNIPVNTENTLTNINDININNNAFQKEKDLKEEEEKSNSKTCCNEKTCKMILKVVLIILILPIILLCLFLIAKGGGGVSIFSSDSGSSKKRKK